MFFTPVFLFLSLLRPSRCYSRARLASNENDGMVLVHDRRGGGASRRRTGRARARHSRCLNPNTEEERISIANEPTHPTPPPPGAPLHFGGQIQPLTWRRVFIHVGKEAQMSPRNDGERRKKQVFIPRFTILGEKIVKTKKTRKTRKYQR